MKRFITATAILLAASVPALAQSTAPKEAGPTQVMSAPPAGKTIGNYLKQNVYDPKNEKIGSVDDIVVSDSGQIEALIVGVGGFVGVGEKDVAVSFNSVHAAMKD